MGEKPELEVKMIERKRWRVIIPKGSSGSEIEELFYKHVGHGLITTRDIEIEFKHPQEEKMYD